MMEPFIEASRHTAIFQLKEFTQTSFYRKEGSTILPERLGISLKDTITRVRKKGRMLTETPIGEINGTFKVAEQSPLKQHPPYRVHSVIFALDEYPRLLGYAILGISGKDGRITRDTEVGMIVLTVAGEGLLKIDFFPWVSTPKEKEVILDYLDKNQEGAAEATPGDIETIADEAIRIKGKDTEKTETLAP